MTPLYNEKDGLITITLNRPEALNALSFSVLQALSGLIDRVEQSDARAVIITGSGDKAFCAGADIKELRNRPLQQQRLEATSGQRLFERIARLQIPSIALINGYAFGGGLELAMACTFRLATANAKFGLPEIKLGLVPGYGGTQRLPRLIGEGRAMEMILTGRTVDAQEALSIGLVNQIVDTDAEDAGARFAAGFTCFSRPVIALARDAVAGALDTGIDEGLRREADLSTLAFQTEDADEGMAAFEQKRKPAFKDR